MAWTVETLSKTVDDEIAALPEDMQSKLIAIYRRIQEIGLLRVGQPHVKHLRGKSMGNTGFRTKRDCPRPLYDRRAAESRYPSRIH